MPAGYRISPGQLLRAALLAAACLAVAGCFGRGVRPGKQAVSVFVSSWNGPEQLLRAAAVVRSARAVEPCVWLVWGDVFTDRVWTELSDGDAQVALLNAAGVDGVVLGPEWLEFGPDRLRQLVDRSRFYVLGANIQDSLGGPLGHPFMFRKLPSATLGLSGVWMDSADFRLGQADVSYVAPDFAVRKVLPLIRPKADVVGVVVRPDASVPKWDVDFVVGAERADMIAVVPPKQGLRRLSLVIQDRRILEYTATEPNPDAAGVDSLAGVALDSIRAALDSVGRQPVARLARPWSPQVVTRELMKDLLKGGIDGFLSDGPVAGDTLKPGPVTNRALVDALASPGRLVLMSLEGQGIKDVSGDRSVQVEWRTALRNQRLVLHRQYSMAMTLDFLARHPGLAGHKYELTAERFWQNAARTLAKAGAGP